MHPFLPQRPLRSRTLPAALLVLAALLAAAPAARAANDTAPGALSVSTTFVSAGFKWLITGDDDSDCAVTLEYRRPGAAWKPAQPLLRVEHGLWTHGEDPGNLLAGSLFFLQPGTAYEARLTLADPDGGTDQRVLAFTTRSVPEPAGRTLYVVPGSGGGTGTQADPFRGLAAADAAARPGDVFLVQAGTYHGKLTVTRDGTASQPIVFRGAGQATVILDGDGGTSSTSNCVSLAGRKYVWIEDMSLVNCLRPVVADNTQDCVVRGCLVQPINQLLSTRGVLATGARGLVVADNTILMPGQWATVGRTGAYGTGGYAIEVDGSGLVLCHNRIVESWDAVCASIDDPTVEMSDVDVYGNFIDRASDDGVQTDATRHNIRVFRNRMVNVGCAMSFQPIFGGPGYLLYNEVYNTRIEPYKFHQETSLGWTQETSGIIAAHNTTVCSRNAWYESGIWRHASFTNNLLLGARPTTPTLSAGYTYPGARFDYDGYARVDGYATLVRFSGGSYANLAAFYSGTGHEQHGVELTTAALASAPLPHDPQWDAANGYGWAYTGAEYDLRLAAGSAAIDRGKVLANIDDGFHGVAPDLGCHEAGAPLPVYGPRTAALGATARADRASGAVPLAVTLTGEATNALAGAVGWRWDFGDSTAASDAQSPAHTYTKAGTYVASLTVTDEDGKTATARVTLQVTTGSTAVDEDPRLRLEPPRCLPNPFHGSATIHFALPRAAAVRLAVYDVSGALVRTLDEGERPAGEHALAWDGRGRDGGPAPAGLYLVELSAEGRRLTRRITLLR